MPARTLPLPGMLTTVLPAPVLIAVDSPATVEETVTASLPPPALTTTLAPPSAASTGETTIWRLVTERVKTAVLLPVAERASAIGPAGPL